MELKKIWANLGVQDLVRTSKFYTELGFRSNGSSAELTSFLFSKDDFVIHFFLRDVLKEAIKGEMANLANGNEIIFTLGTETNSDVDAWAAKVEPAGGRLLCKPEVFGNNYYGFVFADPDGHKFNFFSLEKM